jgi:hypothetical protein
VQQFDSSSFLAAVAAAVAQNAGLNTLHKRRGLLLSKSDFFRRFTLFYIEISLFSSSLFAFT